MCIFGYHSSSQRGDHFFAKSITNGSLFSSDRDLPKKISLGKTNSIDKFQQIRYSDIQRLSLMLITNSIFYLDREMAESNIYIRFPQIRDSMIKNSSCDNILSRSAMSKDHSHSRLLKSSAALLQHELSRADGDLCTDLAIFHYCFQ